MQFSIPHVTGARLYRSNPESDAIVVGTPAWYEWLERHSAFTFYDANWTFTARKSLLHTTEGVYWLAHSMRQGKLYRDYLGYSHALTLERLQATAQVFAREHRSRTLVDASLTQSTAFGPSMQASPRNALTLNHHTALIQTKFHRPHVPDGLISRARLLERLNRGLSGNITLVSAPAGFGKTTLVAQWLQTSDRPSAWLTLDEGDNELLAFIQSLTAALQSAFPKRFHGITNLFGAHRCPSVDQFVSLFIADLVDMPEDLVLVLDDYHLIHNRDIHPLLGLLVEHLPPQLHLVLAARFDPPLPLARWRAWGYLNDLRPADLRFTLEETEAFLTRMLGNEPTREFVSELEELTGGWIAVLRLVALSLSKAVDQTTFLEEFRSHPDTSISQYLLEEVLSQQVSLEQDFLVKTSILEQFCAELCVAILGSDTSYEQVQAIQNCLERLNVLAIPLEERRGWYRFHPLFKQALQQRLQAHMSTEEISTLHLRASAWYAEHGLIEQSVRHALAAGDATGAAQLVEAQVLPAFEQQQWVQVEDWLRLFPEEQLLGRIVLLIAKTWILQAQGQLKANPRLLTSAEQLLDINEGAALESENSSSRLLRTLIATAWSHFHYFSGQFQLSLESARIAWKWLPPGQEYLSSFIQTLLAWSKQATGQQELALLELNKACDLSMHLKSTARLLFAKAWVYLIGGKLQQVEHTARYLHQVAQEDNLEVSHLFAHWLLGVVSYEWNKLDDAIHHFSAVIANHNLAHCWVVQDALRGLALAYQAQGLDAQAQEAARTLIALMQERRNMEGLKLAYAFRGRLALMQDEVEQAEQWLEMVGEQETWGPMPFLEVPSIMKAWLLLARGDEGSVAEGQALLAHLVEHIEAMQNTRKLIEVLALQAWAFDLQGREREALEVLERALSLARPAGFTRTFAHLRPLGRLLHELRERYYKECGEVDNKLYAYLQGLLTAMGLESTSPLPAKTLLRQEALDSLTRRELHLLRLLDQGLTNEEIAREMVVTLGTVKVHNSNVYRKLNVNNRRAAISLARDLRLLATNQA